MYKRLVAVVGALAGVVVCATPGAARLIESWPYDKLMKQSDLVVIAKAVKTEDAVDELPDHRWPVEFVGQNTTFEVKHALKGKVEGKQIKVLHFKFGKPKNGLEVVIIENGPLFVAFSTKNAPEHLLFLKALKDGRYEPVSGRIDPRLSVRMLTDPERELKEEK
jgi:hypothetical protein